VTTRSSLQEVARRSGVSIATASRVLNPHNEHPVSPALRERVLAAAAAADYRVNALARGLKVLRTQTVAIIVHDIRDPYFNECTRGVTDAADAAGYLALVCNSDRDPDTELRYVELASEQRVAGVIFAGSGFASTRYGAALRRHVDALHGYGARAVALSPRRDGLPGEVPDNVGGARAALGTLLDAGRSFTAVLASNDAMAIGCLGELRRRGLDVPRDVSLVGFDDIPFVRWCDPPLTTVSVPMAQIGAAGMRRLLALLDDPLDGGGPAPLVNVHPTELVVRASTAPPPTHPEEAP
jgi:DNA-binding LacI/PurR family transcriptional regulator